MNNATQNGGIFYVEGSSVIQSSFNVYDTTQAAQGMCYCILIYFKVVRILYRMDKFWRITQHTIMELLQLEVLFTL